MWGYRRSSFWMAIGIAFGLGLFLALICSFRLALLIAAVILIMIGINSCKYY